MANPEHLAMLRRGVNNGTAGEWIIPTCFLTEAKLWSADLSDANLHRAGRQGYWRNSSKSRATRTAFSSNGYPAALWVSGRYQ